MKREWRITNPCKKCLVKAMCKKMCEEKCKQNSLYYNLDDIFVQILSVGLFVLVLVSLLF